MFLQKRRKNHGKLTHILLALSLLLMPMHMPLAATSHGAETNANGTAAGTAFHSHATADIQIAHNGHDGHNMPVNADEECSCQNCDGCCAGCAHMNLAVSSVLDIRFLFKPQHIFSPRFDPLEDPLIFANLRPPNRQLS